MKITDEAKKVINEALTKKKADGMRLRTSRSCCGKSLRFELVTIAGEDQPENINGVSVLMDDETRAWTETITIDAANGSLTLRDSASSCCG